MVAAVADNGAHVVFSLQETKSKMPSEDCLALLGLA